jgi:hypothetical protein
MTQFHRDMGGKARTEMQKPHPKQRCGQFTPANPYSYSLHLPHEQSRRRSVLRRRYHAHVIALRRLKLEPVNDPHVSLSHRVLSNPERLYRT